MERKEMVVKDGKSHAAIAISNAIKNKTVAIRLTKERCKHLSQIIINLPGNHLSYNDAMELNFIIHDYQKLGGL